MAVPYYSHGGVTIYHGDCRDLLPSLRADVAITDPPYGEQTHAGARTGDVTKKLVRFASITADDLRSVIAETAASRWWVSFCDWKHGAALEMAPPHGWRFVRAGVWVKPNGAPQFTGDRPGMGWEAVAILHRDDASMRWNGGGHHAVWTEPRAQGDHPTGKPERLVRRLVSLFSDAGETVIDPFMGSGTTLVAARDLGRKAVGIEIDERYCERAALRLSQQVMAFDVPADHSASALE